MNELHICRVQQRVFGRDDTYRVVEVQVFSEHFKIGDEVEVLIRKPVPVTFTYPDTDYPIGHPKRNKGGLRTIKNRTEALGILQDELDRKVITQGEYKDAIFSLNGDPSE